MKQVIQSYRSGKLEVADVPVPALRPGTVLVRTQSSLISAGTERQLVRLAKSSLVGKALARPDLVRQVVRKVERDGIVQAAGAVFSKLDAPVPLGYSLAGEIVDAHPSVRHLAVGDRVACAGAGHACHAEYNVVPKHLCGKVPEGVSDEEASFVTLGAIALQGLRQASPTLGERFVVIGLGLIGQLTVQLLKANGCCVLGYDPDHSRTALALELGADVGVITGLDEAVLDFTDGVGADGVIVAASAPSSEPVRTAARVSRQKGRVVVVGQVGMDLDRDEFYRKELDLRLSMSYGPGRYDPAYEEEGHDYPIGYVRWTEERNMAAFLELVRAAKVTPAALVTHRFPVAAAERAYQLLESEEPSLGIVLSYPSQAPLSRLVVQPARLRLAARGESRIGLIGAGSFARSVLIPALKSVPNVTLGGVVTAMGTSAHHAATKFGFAFAATEPKSVLDDPETGTVVIATRHASHARLACAALEAGKHVFCEKPLALSEDELAQVMHAAATAPGLLTVGFNRRCAPYIKAIKEMLSGRGGPLAMSYRVNAGPVPAGSWVVGEEGGGRILGEVCHFVDTMSYLAGAPVRRVTAHNVAGGDDQVAATLVFADGSVGTLLYTSAGDPAFGKERLEVFAGDRIAVLEDFKRLTTSLAGKRRRRSTIFRDKGHKGLIAAFIAATRGEGPAPMTLAEIANVTRATLAIVAAARSQSERVVE